LCRSGNELSTICLGSWNYLSNQHR
jgi:hypothetical protein